MKLKKKSNKKPAPYKGVSLRKKKKKKDEEVNNTTSYVATGLVS